MTAVARAAILGALAVHERGLDMVCGSCGAVNREGRRFCGQCGAGIAPSCPSCGAVNEPGERFCGDCGASLGPPSAARVRPVAPGAGEVRQVSVLFCDLVGYTALSETRDAEDVRELLSGYFDAARTVVARYGGAVEKFIGDAVMAVWGAPAAHEDDAERAVRAALDLVAAVAAYGEEVGTPVRARAGVVTGRAAALTNPLEGLVVGDRVNTAARVQSVAEPGAVLVDEATREMTAAAISYQDAGVHTVKGKAEPLHLWRAARVIAGVGGELRLDGLEAPLVGRGRELTVVKELFHACLEDRRARLVVITGQPGVGKSRLLWEFEKYVDGLAVDVLWHTGHCRAYGEGVAFSALAEMVRQRLGIALEDRRDVVREKVHAGLERWVLDAGARAFLAPRLAVLLGGEDLELSPRELVAGWRLFFEKLAEGAPVVLAFEDLQWADPGLLDFIEQLLDWSAALPLFVVVLSRPEVFDTRPGLVAGRRNALSVGLDRLPDPAVAALLDGLVRDLPEPAKQLIVTQAEGVPLYAVESVRSLLDRGLVGPRDDGYVLVGELAELRVPPSLSALLSARLDALPPAERQLVREVCVLSGTVQRAAVLALSDLDPDAADEALAGLVRRDILQVRRDPLSPEHGHYSFGQTMLRAVAHDTLSRRERKVGHLRAAEHLRRAFPDDGDDVVEAIAAHYHDAWSAARGDDDAEDLRRLAAEAFERAGGRAAAVGSPLTAAQSYRAAAELRPDPASASALLARSAAMLDRAGRLTEALELYDRLRAEHSAAGRDGEARDLVAPSSHLLVRLGRMTEAETRLREALRDVDATDPASAALVLGLARVVTFRADATEMIAWTDRALEIAAARGDPAVLAEAASLRAHALSFRNRFAESLTYLAWASDLLGPDGPYELRIRVLSNRGVALLGADRPEAREVIETALDTARRAGDVVSTHLCTTVLSALDVIQGRWEEAEQRLLDGLEETETTPEGAVRHATLVDLYSQKGDVQSARRHLQRLADWARSDDAWLTVSYAQLEVFTAAGAGDHAGVLDLATPALRAALRFGLFDDGVRSTWPVTMEAALRCARLDVAAELLATVADAPPGLVPPFLRAHLSRFRGRLRAASGRHDGVEQDLRAAVAELGALGYPYWRAVAQADLGEWLLGQGREDEARPLLDEAATNLRNLGAQPVLRRVEALLAAHRLAGAPS